MRSPRYSVAVLGVLMSLVATGTSGSDAAYRAEIEKQRQEREARLKVDDGYLTLAGLFFLKDGENRIGTDPLNDIVLPEGSAPGEVGVLTFRNGKTTIRVKPGVGLTLNGKEIAVSDLRPGSVDTLAIGSVRFFVHKSGERFALRVRDLNSPIRRDFTGCRWYPIDESYRVTGRFEPYPSPKTALVSNILGDVETYSSPGTVSFTLRGQPLRMEALTSGKRLWFIMRDLTSGKETYPSARFVYADAPAADGTVTLDFNMAMNPPCAFNPYTTCPLPPEQNRLRVRVEAGEKTYHAEKTTDAARR